MNDNTPSTKSEVSVRVSPATIGCFILSVSFFLPWIKFLGANVAGYELRQIWEPGPYLWLIPVMSGVGFLLGLSGRPNVALGQLAGGSPLVFLAIALYQIGGELFKALLIGGWLTLLTGLFLLCVVPRLGKRDSSGSPSAKKNSSAS